MGRTARSTDEGPRPQASKCRAGPGPSLAAHRVLEEALVVVSIVGGCKGRQSSLWVRNAPTRTAPQTAASPRSPPSPQRPHPGPLSVAPPPPPLPCSGRTDRGGPPAAAGPGPVKREETLRAPQVRRWPPSRYRVVGALQPSLGRPRLASTAMADVEAAEGDPLWGAWGPTPRRGCPACPHARARRAQRPSSWESCRLLSAGGRRLETPRRRNPLFKWPKHTLPAAATYPGLRQSCGGRRGPETGTVALGRGLRQQPPVLSHCKE